MQGVVIFTQKCSDGFDSARSISLWAGRYARYAGLPAGEGLTPVRCGTAKPRFAGVPIEFSATHSGGYFACAFSDRPVGLDLQEHRPCSCAGVARRFFHPAEYNYVLRAGEEGFFAVWCAKESYVKYTGDGITDRFGAFSVVRQGRLSPRVESAFLRFLPFAPGYTFCLCTESDSLPRVFPE